ncbi:MAG TPA: RNA-binding S4 domain-containing protein [Brumimicrobium sp.]|nr:RNA-binding S4 domain-containing protein [Brumimicrobium sp.]
MESIEFNLEGDYIELIQLLKAMGIAQTGGHAKMIVEDGGVMRSGEVETRKRAKLRKGDVLEIEDQIKITII